MFYYARVTIIHALKLFLLRTGVVCDPARPASLSPLARSLPPSHVAPPCSRPPRHLNSDKTRRQQSPTGNARASLRSIALLRPAAHLQPNTADLLGPLFANSTQLELDMADRRSGHRGHQKSHSCLGIAALDAAVVPVARRCGARAPLRLAPSSTCELVAPIAVAAAARLHCRSPLGAASGGAGGDADVWLVDHLNNRNLRVITTWMGRGDDFPAPGGAGGEQWRH